jgi:hypothetical protein
MKPELGSILLASVDPDALRGWYEQAFGASPNPDGFLDFDGVEVLIDPRDDIAERSAEPARSSSTSMSTTPMRRPRASTPWA